MEKKNIKFEVGDRVRVIAGNSWQNQTGTISKLELVDNIKKASVALDATKNTPKNNQVFEESELEEI